MVTLTVDTDQQAAKMLEMLRETVPDGTHLCASHAEQALRIARETPLDIVYLCVRAPDGDGLALGKMLRHRYPMLNLILISESPAYAIDAFRLMASDYLLKPVQRLDIERSFFHLRFRREEINRKRVVVRCFGSFEIYVDGAPLHFPRSRAKAVLAFLIDRQGRMCSYDMLLGNLYPDEPATDARKSLMRNLSSDIAKVFRAHGIERILLRSRGLIGLDLRQIECDYYRYLQGDPVAIHSFQGEYMRDYEFAQETAAMLQERMYSEAYQLNERHKAK